MAANRRAAALKAWATRRARGGTLTYRASKSGRHAPILPSGKRGWGVRLGQRTTPKPKAATISSSRELFDKVAAQTRNAMRIVAEIGGAIKAGKRRRGGMAERAMTEWAHYAETTARLLAHAARRRR